MENADLPLLPPVPALPLGIYPIAPVVTYMVHSLVLLGLK